MLVEIEPPYSHVALTAEQVGLLESHAVNKLRLRDADDGGRRLDYGEFAIVSADLLASFEGWTVRRVIDNGSTRKLAEFGQRHTVVTNARCHVAVAGLGLLLIDEVEAHEDLCTHQLQMKLSDGWRIVAVCVQPDQRRPDYILGRSSK